MKTKLIYIIFFAVCSAFIMGCEKDITVDLPQPESKVVVDGYVEPGKPIYVVLTRNAPYFAPIDPNSINAFETGAIVLVNDGFTTDTLVESSSIPGSDVQGVYFSINMLGVEGRTYTLSVHTKTGETLSAITKLPYFVPLDSVWFQVQETLPDNDTLGYVWATLHDPDTLNNCYRWFAMRVGKDSSFIAPIGSTFEDKFINGTTFDFAYNRGSIINSTAEDDINDEAGFFKTGDSIIVKWCAVDRTTYEFWRDAETQVSNNGSPFSAPAPIHSNVIGGLGLFAAYSPSYYHLKAQ